VEELPSGPEMVALTEPETPEAGAPMETEPKICAKHQLYYRVERL